MTTDLATQVADHHEAGLRAHLAGGPTSRQEIIDEVYAYLADHVDDCDPTYQPACDLLLDRLTASGDLDANPIVTALAPVLAQVTDERCRAALHHVALAYSAAFPNDVHVADWNLPDALDVLLEDGGAIVTPELTRDVRIVRTLAEHVRGDVVTPTFVDDEGTTITLGARTVTGGVIAEFEDWDERGWRVVETWPDGTRESWLTRGARGPWDFDTLVCDEVRVVKAVHSPSRDAEMAARLAHEQGVD
jgi:hypothetical protein